MTNADRIRAMTDEELAKFLKPLLYCPYCFAEFTCEGSCDVTVPKWLGEEYDKSCEERMAQTVQGT